MVANQNVVLIPFPQVPKMYLCERKIFLTSKMMNSQPQHIQKREIVDIQIIKHEYKSKKKPWIIQFNHKMPHYKGVCESWSELITNNGKSGPWSRDLLGVQFKSIFSFLLVLSATIPSDRGDGDWEGHRPGPFKCTPFCFGGLDRLRGLGHLTTHPKISKYFNVWKKVIFGVKFLSSLFRILG